MEGLLYWSVLPEEIFRTEETGVCLCPASWAGRVCSARSSGSRQTVLSLRAESLFQRKKRFACGGNEPVIFPSDIDGKHDSAAVVDELYGMAFSSHEGQGKKAYAVHFVRFKMTAQRSRAGQIEVAVSVPARD